MAFIKVVENFLCEKCGHMIKGSGYTNHCPKCLWSKHVDKSPGDRSEGCGGLMEPLRVEGSTPQYRLVHRCVACGAERKNKVETSDSEEALIAVAKRRKAMG